ncbi:hypothetical protein [Cellulomonas hominis]
MSSDGVESGVAELRAVCDDLGAATARVGELRTRRDALVRQALADGAEYAALTEATGLSRSALDAIRRGRRTRRNWTPTTGTSTPPAPAGEAGEGWWGESPSTGERPAD